MSTPAENASCPLDLAAFADGTAQSSHWGKVTSRNATQLRDLLSSLGLILKEAHSEGEIDSSSAFRVALSGCRYAVLGIDEFLSTLSHAGNCSDQLFSDGDGKTFHRLKQLEDSLRDSINVILSTQSIRTVRSKNKTDETEQTHSIKQSFDKLAQEIFNASNKIFPTSLADSNKAGTFTVNEVGLKGSHENKSVCPRASLYEWTSNRSKTFRFRCCCDQGSHDGQLEYKMIAGRSLLLEEISRDRTRQWNILLLKPLSRAIVLVRLSEVLPIYISTIQVLSRKIAAGYLRSQSDAAPANVNTSSENQKELPTHSSNGYRHVEMIRSDSGFPSTRIGKVTYESSGAEALVSNPERVELSHFFAHSTAATSGNEDKKPENLLPEPHFTINLDGNPENEYEYGIIVFMTTLIIHDSNPRGRLYVTLRGANIRRGQDRSNEMKRCNVHFQFDLRKDAEDFSSYVKAMQERLLDLFIQGPFYDEKTVYAREFSMTTATHGLEPKVSVTVVSSVADQRSTQKLRAIITREGHADFVCLDFKKKALEVARRGLTNSLNFMTIWLSDYNLHGKSVVTETNWEKLVLRGAKRASRGGTFVKSGHERTAEDWRKEVDHLIEIMQDKDLKPNNYDRVKIAIIDTGLHPQEKDFCTVEAYKDFVDEGNEMRDDSWHGTCSARIILDMYEEAKLYIARVFKTDQAKRTEGPLLMAKAIEWAIESPRSVDIISISAGFRDYSKDLQDAVAKASAAGVLVLAAASNWRNTSPVAYPARHRLNTICVFSTNTGDQGSDFNPEPRDDAPNFAFLGEMFRHPDQRRDERMSGTSRKLPIVATAMAAGLAARILDFSRQPDNRPHIFRADDVGKLAGMLAIFNFMSKPAGRLKCVAPLKLLPLKYGVDRDMERQRVRHNLSLAMENAD